MAQTRLLQAAFYLPEGFIQSALLEVRIILPPEDVASLLLPNF